MAGGAGTRLWPMSRPDRPKQLLPLIGGETLLAIAANRLEGVVPDAHRYICTGERHRALVRSVLPSFGDERILGEPVGRDTVNAVGLTAAVLAAHDPSAIFAVLTADHLIEPQATFRAAMNDGFALVEEDPRRFVTFGITPTFPATGFGYVERGAAITGHDRAFLTQRFVEKPDERTAQSYLDAGTFLWNSGMFIFGAAAFMEALRAHVPDSASGLERIAAGWNGPDRVKLLAEIYPTLPKTSVDYGILEPVSREPGRICVVPMDVAWTDVGSWPSYGETLQPDAHGNRSNARALHIDSRNVLAVTDDPTHVIATIECSDLIIVRTKDATLVCRTTADQRVKEVAARVAESS